MSTVKECDELVAMSTSGIGKPEENSIFLEKMGRPRLYESKRQFASSAPYLRKVIKRCPSLVILFLSCFLVGVQAQVVDVKMKDNKLTMSSKEIAIKEATFFVEIIENGKDITLVPSGQPKIKTVDRITPLMNGRETTYTWATKEGYEISWIVTNIADNTVTLKAEIVNKTNNEIYLKQFCLLNTPDNQFIASGKASDWMLASTDVESRRWGKLDADLFSQYSIDTAKAYSRNYFTQRGLSKKRIDRKWRCYYNDFTLYKNPGISGLSVAAVDTITAVFFDIRVEGTKMKIEIYSDMSEVELTPGESRKSDEVLLLNKPWNEAQKDRCSWIKSMTGTKITKQPLLGWCSWYRSATGVKSQDVLNISSYSSNQHSNIPLQVIQIDDGWQVNYGTWTENEKFKKGIKDVADSIRAQNMMAGIWLTPVTVDVVNNKRQKPIDWYVGYKINKPSLTKLDPTNPNVKNFITDALKYSLDRGYRYFKLDFSGIGYCSKRFYNPKYTHLQAQRELYRIYREAIGDSSYLLACGISDQRSIVPFADADRMGTDCDPNSGFARNLSIDDQPSDIHGFWYPIITMANKCYENGTLTIGDPDVAFTGMSKKCKPLQLRTFHSFVGIFGGLAFTSDYFNKPTFDKPDNLRMMQILNPVSAEKGHNFAGGWDMFGKEFGYPVSRSYGNFTNVIIWNPNHHAPENLGIKEVPTDNLGKKFHAWSFWDERYLGTISSDYIAQNVPVYQHQLLRLTPLSHKPIVIGSNLHISMGATEIKSIVYQGNKVQLELNPNAGARNGRIYFYSEKNISDAITTNGTAMIVKKQANVYVLILTNRAMDRKEVVDLTVSNTKETTIDSLLNDKENRMKYLESSFSKEWETTW